LRKNTQGFLLALILIFSLGAYVALSSLPELLDAWNHPREPIVRKAFVPPPRPTIVSVSPPEIPADAVPALKTAQIPGLVDLPKGRTK
jgi:hypothetical protein